MDVDSLRNHQVLLLHCSITCIYFTGIFVYLFFSNDLYNLETYKFISILSTLIFAELLKMLLTSFQSNHLLTQKVESSNVTKPKRTISKIAKDGIKFVLATVGITVTYYIAAVLFGAPILTHHKETLMLAFTLTTLTMIPASLHLGVNNAIALFIGSNLPISGIFIDAVKLNIKSVLLGTWLSAFVLPLDWDKPWQAWPIPCIVGALLGYFVAYFITFIKISTTKFKKKTKKCETFKTC